MKRITTAFRILLAAFLIPWMAMASFFALSQTRPPKIDVPVLRDAMKLTPVWHNLRTAYQNQHRLVLAGLPLAAIISAASIVIKPKKRRVVLAYTIAAGVLIALAANALDCCWLFRLRPEWIGTQTIIRSIPWIIIAAISMLFTTGKERAEPSSSPYSSPAAGSEAGEA